MLQLKVGDRLKFNPNGIVAFRGGVPIGVFHSTLTKAAGARVQTSLIPDVVPNQKLYTVHESGRITDPSGKEIKSRAFKNKAPKQESSKPSSTGKVSPTTPPGTRWITIHPHGDDSKGIPILIRENPDGSASVVGGAGGKLNFLHLSRTGSPEDWKAKASVRRKAKAEKEKKRKESQTDEEKDTEATEKTKAKEFHQTKKQENALATLEALDKHGIDHGLSDEHLEALKSAPPEDDPEAVERHRQLNREALTTARKIQQAYEHKLVTDHEARAAAILGDTPLGDVGNAVIENREHTVTSPTGETLSTVQQLPDGNWLVRSEDPEAPDLVFDDWKDAAKQHVRNVLEAEQHLTDGDRTQDEQFYDPKQWVKDHPEESLPEGFTFKVEAAKEIANLALERKQNDKNLKLAEKAIEQGSPFSPGYDLERGTGEVADDALAKLEENAKTLEDAITNGTLLKLVGQNEAAALKGHVDSGGYSKLAEIASEVLKTNTVSRRIIDAVGHNEAAKLLAYQMKQELGEEEYKRVATAQAALHAQTSSEIAKRTAEETQPMLDQLAELHNQMLALQDSADGNYSPDAQLQLDNLAYKSQELQSAVHKKLGLTIGQLQASAAMVAALEGEPKTLRFIGTGDLKSVADLAPKMFREKPEEGEKQSLFDAFGLGAEDFELEDSSDGQLIKINESGIKKLIEGSFNPEDKEAYETAQAIKRGDFDDPNYTPPGFVFRPKATFSDFKTEANSFNTSLDIVSGMSNQEIEQSLQEYIGSRVANGDNPLDVLQDVRSPHFYNQLGHDPYGSVATQTQECATQLASKLAKSYVQAQVESGKMKPEEAEPILSGERISDAAIRHSFNVLASREASRQRSLQKTDDIETLNQQSIESESAIEAAHRTLAAMPMARVALKPLQALAPAERKWLREYAITEVWGQQLTEPPAKKPDTPTEDTPQQFDLFGNPVSNDEALGSGEESTPEMGQWEQFSKLVGGEEKAYEAAADQLKGKFYSRFASAYGAISGEALKLGGASAKHIDRVLLAKMDETSRNQMLEFMQQREASDIAKVRSRAGGKFARELDDEWLSKYEDLKGDNRQLALFTSDTGRSDRTSYQRTTLGENVEAQLESVLKDVVPNFEQISRPVDLIPEVRWTGDHANKQRVVKLLQERKKLGCWFGAGSGKSATALGAFTELHNQGQVKRMISAVPSGVLGQFVEECVNFLAPGKYQYNANLGFNAEQRLKALTDPNLHVHLTTRESLSNDLLALVETHTGITKEKFAELSDTERQDSMSRALLASGVDPKDILLNVDEAHDISSRQGVAPSNRALAIETLGALTNYYLPMTGTPVKNDASEAFSFLKSVAPDKFNDRKKFMAEYGSNTVASQRALQRVLAPYTYASATKPRDKSGRLLEMREDRPTVQLSAHQKEQRSAINQDYEVVRDWYGSKVAEVMANMKTEGEFRPLNREDFSEAWADPSVRAALTRLAGGDEHYAGLSEAEQASLAGGQVMASAAMRMTALNRLYHQAPFEHNPKAQKVVEMAKNYVKNEGKPGVVFAASSVSAEMLVKEMGKHGLRVGYIDGSLSAEQKATERLKFSPGEGQSAAYDVLVCTDAAQTGLNLQRGKWLAHFDIPMTQKAYDQRSARIYRMRQTEDVNVHTLMADAPEEHIAIARMERKGEEGSVYQQKTEHIDDTGLSGEIERLRQMQQSDPTVEEPSELKKSLVLWKEDQHPRDSKGRFIDKSGVELTEAENAAVVDLISKPDGMKQLNAHLRALRKVSRDRSVTSRATAIKQFSKTKDIALQAVNRLLEIQKAIHNPGTLAENLATLRYESEGSGIDYVLPMFDLDTVVPDSEDLKLIDASSLSPKDLEAYNYVTEYSQVFDEFNETLARVNDIESAENIDDEYNELFDGMNNIMDRLKLIGKKARSITSVNEPILQGWINSLSKVSLEALPGYKIVFPESLDKVEEASLPQPC
ncbi:MAG: SNF2-related protein [Desertifilum sp.]|nr:SNF2-related protein [Desertifilum sp.]